MQTLIDLFNTFEALGDKTAFVNRTGVRRLVVSYREFYDLALKMANLLAQDGMVPGDGVMIWGSNSSWWQFGSAPDYYETGKAGQTRPFSFLVQ